MWYPNPNFSEISDIFGFSNYVTNGLFSLFSLLAIWFIAFAFFKRYETKVAIAGSTALTFLLSIPLVFIKYNGVPLVDPSFVLVLLILTAISGMWLWKND
ncbi:MAG: hypothetical protein QW228_05960 [Candidatus Aenigmatarchaeota archaeon]